MLKTRLVFLVHLQSALPYVNSQCILSKYNACEGGHYIFVKSIIVFSHDTQWVSDGYPLGIMGNPKPFDFYSMLSPWGWALQESGQHLAPSHKALIPVKPLSA